MTQENAHTPDNEVTPATVNAKEVEKINSILKITSKRHVKIWLLHSIQLPSKAIAIAMGTNGGHVGNVLRDYKAHPEKIEAAEKMMP